MMATRWCHNAKTGEIFSYKVSDGLTDFPRGDWLAYGDYLTTDFASRAEAEQWGRENTVCLCCRSVRPGQPGDSCPYCSTTLGSGPEYWPANPRNPFSPAETA